ncbi:MAG: recombinase family protein [Candidatus Pelethousia sp.]|nr:recombinase family protein [Candidatus Pelethousia sp.]
MRNTQSILNIQAVEIQNRVSCLYRVSTPGQVDKVHDDIPMQRTAYREFIEQQGWTLVDELAEKGISGYKVSAPFFPATSFVDIAAVGW